MSFVSRSQSVREADNLTAVCEPIVWTVCDPQHLTALQTFTISERDSFALPFFCHSLYDLVCSCILWEMSAHQQRTSLILPISPGVYMCVTPNVGTEG
jgi:hypothetical protein